MSEYLVTHEELLQAEKMFKAEADPLTMELSFPGMALQREIHLPVDHLAVYSTTASLAPSPSPTPSIFYTAQSSTSIESAIFNFQNYSTSPTPPTFGSSEIQTLTGDFEELLPQTNIPFPTPTPAPSQPISLGPTFADFASRSPSVSNFSVPAG